jgi:hypothetical protein
MTDIIEVVLHLSFGTLAFYDREMWGRRGTFWGLFVVLFGIWGFIVYLCFNHDTLLFTIDEAVRRIRGERGRSLMLRRAHVIMMTQLPEEEDQIDY